MASDSPMLPTSLQLAFEIDCLDARPVSLGCGLAVIMVVRPLGDFTLMAGGVCIAHMRLMNSIPGPAKCPGCTNSAFFTGMIIPAVSASVMNTNQDDPASLLTLAGSRITRFEANLTSDSSLVESALSAFDSVLPSSLSLIM